jgi:hypothetical protein
VHTLPHAEVCPLDVQAANQLHADIETAQGKERDACLLLEQLHQPQSPRPPLRNTLNTAHHVPTDAKNTRKQAKGDACGEAQQRQQACEAAAAVVLGLQNYIQCLKASHADATGSVEQAELQLASAAQALSEASTLQQQNELRLELVTAEMHKAFAVVQGSRASTAVVAAAQAEAQVCRSHACMAVDGKQQAHKGF